MLTISKIEGRGGEGGAEGGGPEILPRGPVPDPSQNLLNRSENNAFFVDISQYLRLKDPMR